MAGYKYPYYTIPDLSEDQHYSKLEYVKGAPYYKFFLGTPLITWRGIRIGTLCILDTEHRPQPSKTDLAFLGVIAGHVMQQLEMWRACEQQKRHMTMSRGLAAFVDGRDHIPAEWKNDFEYAKTSPFVPLPDYPSEDADSDEHATASSERTHSVSARTDISENAPTTDILERASNLLRESLCVSYTAIFDADMSYTILGSESELNTEPITAAGLEVNGNVSGPGSSANAGGIDGTKDAPRRSDSKKRPALAKLVSFSTEKAGAEVDDVIRPKAILTIKFLKKLLQRYPTGKIWSFDTDGALVSSEEDPITLGLAEHGDSSSESGMDSDRKSTTKRESKVLIRAFPAARQILYASLWDHGDSEYASACFAVSLHAVPVFTSEIEVAFVRAFVNSVGVVAGQAKLSIADKQKSDFIASISHVSR